MSTDAIKLIGNTATLPEWDGRIPSFDEVHNKALKANKFSEQQLATSSRIKSVLRAQLRELQRKWSALSARPGQRDFAHRDLSRRA